jgi:hypothetical protein
MVDPFGSGAGPFADICVMETKRSLYAWGRDEAVDRL